MMLIVVCYHQVAKCYHKWVNVALTVLVSSVAINLSGCTEGTFVTPPTQPLGNTLNSTSAEQHPRLSYEGRYMVFASDRQGKRSIWLYDTQNGRLLPLPGLNQPGTVQDQPDISADGRYIVYVSEQEGKSDIFIYDRQSLEGKNITQDLLGEVRHPTISGNGRFIAFEFNRSGQWDIIIYDRGLNTPLSLPGNPETDIK
ncbi:biopolymer transporter [Crocosphaera sp. UHCC 0190]|uniref:TolB family protein n=1 Tax=Crocosphaera sp. UHCC 0190 TaxID=3110246 RepID=UPI002B1FA771|nr:biopolymer transporter [Crocosphaera sp. UHCC 0190]MEA5509887.1 biopolymer transporter [Crocosphaera sp. UHCC 0190]